MNISLTFTHVLCAVVSRYAAASCTKESVNATASCAAYLDTLKAKRIDDMGCNLIEDQ